MSTETRPTTAVSATTTIDELIERDPGVLEVLEAFGIRLDPWTMIALKSSIEQLAEYSAIRRPADLSDAIESFMEARLAD